MLKRSLNFLCLSLLLMVAPSAFSAPLCSGVFKTFDARTFERTLENLARLKIEFDLNKTKSSDVAEQTVAAEYPQVLQQLLFSLDGRFSQKEVLERIRKKITAIQDRQGKEKALEDASIAEVRKILISNEMRPSFFQKEAEIPFDVDFHFSPGQSPRLLPDGRMLYSAKDGLHIFNLTKQKDLNLKLDAEAYETDGFNLYGIFQKHLYIFDLQGNKAPSKFNLPEFSNQKFESTVMQLSPQKSLVLLTGTESRTLDYHFTIMDLQTGAEVFNRQKVQGVVTRAAFLGETHLMVLIDEKTLQRIDITTGKVEQSVELKMPKALSFSISQDQNTLAVFGWDEAYTYETHNLENIRAQKPARGKKSNEFYREPQKMPGIYSEIIGFSSTDGPRVVNTETLEDVFRFENRYGSANTGNYSQKTFGMAVAPDKSQVVIIHSHNNSKISLHIWKLHED